DSLDPALIQFSGDYTLAQLIFPPLLTLDDHNQVAPWGADSWKASADGLTWTLHIRPGMKWSDGVPIDAGTYAYSINRSLDPCTAGGTGYFLSGTGPELITDSVAFNGGTCPAGMSVSPETLVGKSIVAPDPQTLVLHLSHPAAYFPVTLTYATAWAQPKQLIERYGNGCIQYDRETCLGWTDYLAGCGGNLFTVKRWDHAGHLDLVRNEGFWGTKPKLREIAATLYSDTAVAWADYQAGQGDYVSSVPVPEVAHASAIRGFHADPDAAISYLAPDWTVPPFNDVRVRQAFALALDRRKLAAWVAYPLPEPPASSVLPTIHLVPEGIPGYNPNLADPAGRTGEEALSPDVAKAGALWKAYLADKWGGDASKAPRVALFYRPQRQQALVIESRVDEYLSEWHAALPGVQVVAYELDATATCAIHGCRRMLSIAQWVMQYPDPQDVLSLLMRTGPDDNSTGISVPSADALMDKADANPDLALRMQQYQEAEQQLVTAVAWIPVAQSMNYYCVRPRVAGGYHERMSEIASLAVWQRVFVLNV
ncbi:MAG TPA: ABC transporter substrate-binding protein, partial [Ktedonobacterales bacterium]